MSDRDARELEREGDSARVRLERLRRWRCPDCDAELDQEGLCFACVEPFLSNHLRGNLAAWKLEPDPPPGWSGVASQTLAVERTGEGEPWCLREGERERLERFRAGDLTCERCGLRSSEAPVRLRGSRALCASCALSG